MELSFGETGWEACDSNGIRELQLNGIAIPALHLHHHLQYCHERQVQAMQTIAY